MKTLRNNQGFTIMEIMIVIIIIAIGLSLSVYSINIIFGSNANSFADQFKSDLRYIRDQNMATTSGTYRITWNVDVNGVASYQVLNDTDVLKTIQIHRAVQVTYEGGSVDGVTIVFDSADGIATINPAGTNPTVVFQFINNASNTTATVTLVEATGRVE